MPLDERDVRAERCTQERRFEFLRQRGEIARADERTNARVGAPGRAGDYPRVRARARGDLSAILRRQSTWWAFITGTERGTYTRARNFGSLNR